MEEAGFVFRKHKSEDMEALHQRTELLLGTSAVEALKSARVILFGVGGVGGWCAESLIRSGIGHLTIVDSDVVNPTNLNRQLVATTQTVGRPKVEVLRERLLSINPEAEIVAHHALYTPENAASYALEGYHYVVDAIDSLENKAHLLQYAASTSAVVVSSMGAALKLDPTRISVAEFWKVRGCPLAAALRRRFKRDGVRLRRKVKCVYSEELLQNAGAASADEAPEVFGGSVKARTNGSLAHIVAIFGFTLAGLVVQDIWKKASASPEE